MKVLDDATVAVHDRELSTLLMALTQLRRGNASVRMPLHWTGIHGKVAEVFNDLVE